MFMMSIIMGFFFVVSVLSYHVTVPILESLPGSYWSNEVLCFSAFALMSWIVILLSVCSDVMKSYHFYRFALPVIIILLYVP